MCCIRSQTRGSGSESARVGSARSPLGLSGASFFAALRKRGKVLYLIIESRPLVRDFLHSEDLIQDKEEYPHARRQDEPPVSNVRDDRGAKQNDQSRRF